eukprot:CAMPEP_0117569438 /NCGR_PEP_ID=MMETSP0784-20121206/58658_1 /TAXON_ID=39447 /ORGANISM="" /LENGTH=237 /DNA_ID=CAMNT_0005367411 /DNA_START=358 /DNA_END=1073 /DNA_ORIENTATION=-
MAMRFSLSSETRCGNAWSSCPIAKAPDCDGSGRGGPSLTSTAADCWRPAAAAAAAAAQDGPEAAGTAAAAAFGGGGAVPSGHDMVGVSGTPSRSDGGVAGKIKLIRGLPHVGGRRRVAAPREAHKLCSTNSMGTFASRRVGTACEVPGTTAMRAIPSSHAQMGNNDGDNASSAATGTPTLTARVLLAQARLQDVRVVQHLFFRMGEATLRTRRAAVLDPHFSALCTGADTYMRAKLW